MGCWNETCGLSGLPIQQGDPVHAYVLVRQEWAPASPITGTCYSNDYYDHLFLPLQGTYDDYGGVENLVMDDHAQYCWAQIQRWMVEGRWRIDPDRDLPISCATLAEALGNVERGWTTFGVQDWKGREVAMQPVSMVLTLQEVEDDLCQQWRTLQGWSVDLIKEAIDHKVLQLREGLEEQLSLMFVWGVALQNLTGLAHYYVDYLNVENWGDVEGTWRHLLTVDALFSRLRRQWLPPTGKGSQATDFALHAALAHRVGAYADRREALERSLDDE
jgi:hypothetical protein